MEDAVWERGQITKQDQSGVLSALPEARCFLTWKKVLLSCILNLVEEVVNGPKRMGRSDVGRKRHLCDRSEGRKHVTHLGNASISLLWSRVVR